jgi:osmoprotectant transport system substrate-binding protein
MRESRRLVLGAGLLALLLLAAACGEDSGEDGNGPADTGTGAGGECAPDVERSDLTVGVSATFAENQIVAEMYAQVLEDCGYTVSRQLELGSREVSQPALVSGEIDVKPEYLSSLLLFYDPEATASNNPDEVVSALEPLLAEDDLTLLEASAADDTNAFVVTEETADEFDLASVSDLADVAGELVLGGPAECPERPFCIPGLQEVYGVEFGEFRPLDVGGPLTVEALDAGEIDVALLFTTSSVIGDKGWVVLEDDQGLQNAENIAPVVRNEVLNDEVEGLLNAVSATLTTENITELNGRVEIDQEDPATVADEFLSEQGLL